MREIKKIIVFLVVVGHSLLAQNLFTPVDTTGLPYHIIISSLKIDGESAPLETQIGVFDDSLCVGAGTISAQNRENIDIVAWQQNLGYDLAGFVPGDSIVFMVGLKRDNEIYTLRADAKFNRGDGTFGSSSYSIVELSLETEFEPEIEVSSGSLDFGKVELDSTIYRNFTITNPGSDTLDISRLSTSNDFFGIIDTTACLPPSDSLTIQISFTPTTAGKKEDTLLIRSNAKNTDQDRVILKGYGFYGYFDPVKPTGLPYLIVIQSVNLDNESLPANSEIAVFDDELCVGRALFNGQFPIQLSAWQKDAGHNLPGFENGDTIKYKLWKGPGSQPIIMTASYQSGDGTFGSGAYSAVSLTEKLAKIDNFKPIKNFKLISAYPNPFNSRINFVVKIQADRKIALKIYNLEGKKIFGKEFFSNYSGFNRFQWNGRNQAGESVTSGVYLATLGNRRNYKKLKLIYLK